MNMTPRRRVAGARSRLIAASLVGAGTGESAPAPAPTGAATALLSGIPQQGAALGRPDAPVTLVEFADLQCPYCAAWADGAFAELVRDYVRPGKVRIVFGGLAFIGPDSETGLRFVLAAGRQGKLWQSVHLLASQGAGELRLGDGRVPARPARRSPAWTPDGRFGRHLAGDRFRAGRARSRRRSSEFGNSTPSLRADRIGAAAVAGCRASTRTRSRPALDSSSSDERPAPADRGRSNRRTGARHRRVPHVCAIRARNDRVCDRWLRDGPSSRYAELAGIPVAALGLTAYAFVLGTVLQRPLARARSGDGTRGRALRRLPARRAARRHRRPRQWCLASDLVLDALAVACLLRLRAQMPAENPY